HLQGVIDESRRRGEAGTDYIQQHNRDDGYRTPEEIERDTAIANQIGTNLAGTREWLNGHIDDLPPGQATIAQRIYDDTTSRIDDAIRHGRAPDPRDVNTIRQLTGAV